MKFVVNSIGERTYNHMTTGFKPSPIIRRAEEHRERYNQFYYRFLELYLNAPGWSPISSYRFAHPLRCHASPAAA